MDDRDLARIAIVVPQVGEAIAEAYLLQWQVNEGDSVVNGDVLFVVDTDKAEVDVEAFTDGLIEQILISAGSQVLPGQRVGSMLVDRSDVPPDIKTVTTENEHSPANDQPAPGLPKGGSHTGARVKGASPFAKRRASELGIDIAQVMATVDGNVSAEDVEAFSRKLAQNTKRGPQRGRLQELVARATTISKQTVPHFYLDMAVDMMSILSHRQTSANSSSITSYVVSACVLALTEHPDLNVSLIENRLIHREEVSVGVAVDTDQGLLVPVLTDLVGLGLPEIQNQLSKAIRRARQQRLNAGDNGPRSMVVTNLGMFGVERFHAIINKPDPFILAVGKAEDRVVVIDREIRIRPTAVVSLSADHRIVDGAAAARFLASVTAHLESLKGSVSP